LGAAFVVLWVAERNGMGVYVLDEGGLQKGIRFFSKGDD